MGETIKSHAAGPTKNVIRNRVMYEKRLYAKSISVAVQFKECGMEGYLGQENQTLKE